jgi:type I restriction enzyme S subunit
MTNTREIELGELMPQEGRSSVNPADYPGEVFELLSIPAYDRGSAEIALGSEIGSTKQAVQPGDVLLSKIVPHIRRAWVVEPSAGSRQIASSEWLVFRSKEADARYLHHFLVSDGFHRQFMQTVSGVGGSLLRARPKYVAKIKIPLPPLEEQRRIAAILDKAEGLASLQIRASLIDREWLCSVYSVSFADSDSQIGISIEEALEDQILLLHKDGNHGSSYPRAEDFGAEGVPFISAKSIDDSGAIIDARVARLSEEKAKSLRIGWLEPGDVLLAHNASVGKTALYEGQYQRAVIGTSLTAFRPNPNRLNSRYLFHYLSSPSFQAALAADMSQTTRNQVPITAQRKLALRIPPLSKQEEFAAIAVSAQRLARKRVESFRSVDILRKTLFSALLAL